MSFNIGLSGLNAASEEINVTGNNIANASTVGFKKSRTEFVDVFAASVLGGGSNQQGSGVSLQNIAQDFSQGRQVGLYLVIPLCALQSESESCHDLIEDKYAAMCVADCAQGLQKTR